MDRLEKTLTERKELRTTMDVEKRQAIALEQIADSLLAIQTTFFQFANRPKG
jgi:hypothetical protein